MIGVFINYLTLRGMTPEIGISLLTYFYSMYSV